VIVLRWRPSAPLAPRITDSDRNVKQTRRRAWQQQETAHALIDWLVEHPNRSLLQDRMERVHRDLHPLTPFYFGFSQPALTPCSMPT
jgi:hypothetical protein